MEIVHRRNVRVLFADLCSTMDLCAVSYQDTTISVYRTLSWEKVLSVFPTELFLDTNCGSPTAIAFSLCGCWLSIGMQSGIVGILEIESCRFVKALNIHSPFCSHLGAIISIRWITESSSVSAKHIAISSLPFGLKPWEEPGGDFLPLSHVAPSLGVQLCFHASGLLRAYFNGIYPLFSVLLFDGGALISSLYRHELKLLIESPSSGKIFTCDLNLSLNGTTFQVLNQLSVHWNGMENELNYVSEKLSFLGRKWKENSRVICPKLILLKGLLVAYEIPMSPIEFLHSVALGGQWHECATTHFSQHWNEQSIVRLKSSIEAVNKSLIWTFQFCLVPVVKKMLVRCRDILSIYDGIKFSSQKDSEQCKTYLSRFAVILEQFLFKLDDALEEVNLASEMLILYLQFIREMMFEHKTGSHQALRDPLLRKRMVNMLDPRRYRDCGQLNSCEVVTGTNVIGFFQDSINDSVDIDQFLPVAQHTFHIKHTSIILFQECFEMNACSLFRFMKVAKAVKDSALSSIHDIMSSQVVRTCFTLTFDRSSFELSGRVLDDHHVCFKEVIIHTYSEGNPNSKARIFSPICSVFIASVDGFDRVGLRVFGQDELNIDVCFVGWYSIDLQTLLEPKIQWGWKLVDSYPELFILYTSGCSDHSQCTLCKVLLEDLSLVCQDDVGDLSIKNLLKDCHKIESPAVSCVEFPIEQTPLTMHVNGPRGIALLFDQKRAAIFDLNQE